VKQLWLIAALMPSLLFGQFDFRKTTWGMSKEEVTTVEGKPLGDRGDALSYSDTVGPVLQPVSSWSLSTANRR
jgi:hypothetical protein